MQRMATSYCKNSFYEIACRFYERLETSEWGTAWLQCGRYAVTDLGGVDAKL